MFLDTLDRTYPHGSAAFTLNLKGFEKPKSLAMKLDSAPRMFLDTPDRTCPRPPTLTMRPNRPISDLRCTLTDSHGGLPTT